MLGCTMKKNRGYCPACEKNVPVRPAQPHRMDSLLVPLRVTMRALHIARRPRFTSGYQCQRCHCLVRRPGSMTHAPNAG